LTAVGAALLVVPACSSESSGGSGGAAGSGGTSGVGGTGNVAGSGASGGATGGVGGGTGGTSTGGTGGGDLCSAQLQGQQCSIFTGGPPAQVACVQGDCCDEANACLADASCAAITYCLSTCIGGGGSEQTCITTCQPCATSQAAVDLYNAIGTCVQACIATDGSAGSAGSAGAPADAAAD
jgi:hypothetical protein